MPTVRTNDVDTYYEERGEGTPVVFVHGMFMNASQWEPQVEALAGRYRTVAYDVRGHGRTGGSDRASYDVELFAADLEALLEALGIEDAVVVGLSMGGAIAQVHAARFPDRVAGLVLADTFTTATVPLGSRLLLGNLRFLGRLDRFIRYPTLNRLQMRVGNLLSPGVAGDAAAIQAVLETGPRLDHAEVVKVADAVAAVPDSDVDVSGLTVPTLLLQGEHLPGAMAAMQDALADQLGDAVVDRLVVPGAGHASNLDNPEWFTGALEEFLDSGVGARSPAPADASASTSD